MPATYEKIATATISGTSTTTVTLSSISSSYTDLVLVLRGGCDNSSMRMQFNSGLWMNTNAITSVKIFPGDGNWVQYTQFALYGIKGA